MKRPSGRVLGLVLLALSIVVIGYHVHVSTNRELSGLETSYFGLATTALGVLGTWLYSKEESETRAQQHFLPLARSALRRVVSLYGALDRVSLRIRDESERLRSQGDASPALQSAESSLRLLEAVVQEHAATARDAIQDWGDVLPSESKDLAEQFSLTVKVAELQQALEQAQVALSEAEAERDDEVVASRRKVETLLKEKQKLQNDLAQLKAKSPITLPSRPNSSSDLLSGLSLWADSGRGLPLGTTIGPLSYPDPLRRMSTDQDAQDEDTQPPTERG